MFLVRNRNSNSQPIRPSVAMDSTSRHQLRFIGALLGAFVPFSLTVVAYMVPSPVIVFGLFAYAAAIGCVVGAWRAPAVVGAESGKPEAAKAAAVGVAIGTAILTAASAASLLIPNLASAELEPLVVLGGLLAGLVVGTAIGYPSALISV